MLSERITESIIRQKFQPYHTNGFIVEEQGSKNSRINKLLQYASKGGEGKGYPDFIIQSETDTDFLMVVECKASVKKHKSATLDHFADYAVDGALLYSSYLAKEFDVIALGVSGQKADSLLADSFLQLKTHQKPIPFINTLLELPDYQKKYIYKEETRNQRFETLLEYNKELNQTLHTHKIREADRSLLLSGILIALEHEAFKNSYMLYKTAEQLAEALLNAVINELQNASIPNIKIKTLEHSYSFIKTNATLSNNRALFINLIKEIDNKVNSFAKTYKFFDIFGEFYIEFLRYANNDKGLGIVLTPKHITELFCELADLTKDSIVFDNCCGTGGFLISAMRNMIEKANHNTQKEIEIKKKQIIGIEYQDSIFPLACSNMIIHGDGKTNIINDNCFNDKYGEIKETNGKIIKNGIKLIEHINKKLQPTVGMLNPPFKTDKKDTEELSFVLNNLEGLEQNGLCLAILPMQCALSNKGERLAFKIKLLKNHTLKAVVSFPDELFYNSNVNVVTCAMIIIAHKPHPKDYKTYFGYWKNDNFIKRKTKGRVDFFGKWRDIKEKWIKSYKNKENIAGISIMMPVSAKDEWCAEEYMETNYKVLNRNNFINTLLKYTSFLFLNQLIPNASNKYICKKNIELNIVKWVNFNLNDKNLFAIKGSKTTPTLELKEHGKGKYPYVTTQATNNGIDNFYNYYTENGEVITFDSAVVGYCAYQPLPFSASDHVEKLIPKFKMNKYIALFLVTILNQEQYRFNYGRKCSQARMRKMNIKLPSKNGAPDWQFMEDYIKSLPYSSSI